MSDLTIDYIQGWMDRQSQVNVGGRSIVATSKDFAIIRQVYASLMANGIKCDLRLYSLPGKKRGLSRWELRIGSKKALASYNKVIGFRDPEKKSRLTEIVS